MIRFEELPEAADGRDPLVTLRPGGERDLVARFEGWAE